MAPDYKVKYDKREVHLRQMSLVRETSTLLSKELKLEFRQLYALSSLMLYAVSTCMVVYMAFHEMEPLEWVTILWIILLFASLNAVGKSFWQEGNGRNYYYYYLCSPLAIILSKIIYNCLLLLAISFITLAIYSLFLGNPVENMTLFGLSILLGATGFAVNFTLLAGIAAKADNNATLTAILGFPLIIPLLGMVIRISKNAVLGVESLNTNRDLMMTASMISIAFVLSLVLFPYLWRD